MASPPRRLTHAELYDEIRELVRQTTSRGEIANRPETA
jgi:hypothetical protein